MARFNAWEVAMATISACTGNTLLYGPPGTGKSYAGQRAGVSSDVANVTLTPDTPAAELRGHYHPRGGEFVWVDGPVVKAMREGRRLVVNEVNHAGGDTLSFLLAALDNRDSARLTLPSGETVTPAPGYHVVGTMNGQPDELLPALRDRFAACVEIVEPHPDAIDALPEDLRNAARGTVSAPGDDRITLRAWLAFAALRPVIGAEHAAAAVFGSNYRAVLDSLTVAA
jgi:nitric oxide reductase NorQ protein